MRLRNRLLAWIHALLFGPYCVRCEDRHGVRDFELCDLLVRQQERELFAIEHHHPGGLP